LINTHNAVYVERRANLKKPTSISRTPSISFAS
jgi:hypothetical protein